MTIKEIKTGQDSFLDIIANLVGILIILVVVVGAQAKQSWVKSEPDPSDIANVEQLKESIDEAQRTEEKLTADNRELEDQIKREAQLGTSLAKHRHRMLVQFELINQQVAEKKDQLEADRKIVFDKNVQKASLEAEVAEIVRETNAVQTMHKQRVETIEHYPTPIAKTVFSDEVHFRLSGGKLVYVPMDELTDLMKSEWKVKAEKLRQSPTTLETVGPINGFRMQYELEVADVHRTNEFGKTMPQQVVRLSRFVLVPVMNAAGETVSQAIQNHSEFRNKIQRRPAKNTTVSIWVYPDSFSHFNDMKTWLRGQGYQTACWPLSDGKLISGGPNGFRTSAQ